MIISCPECSGRFRIDSTALGAAGRTVRCGKCAHTWLQAPPDSEAGAGPAEAADPQPAADAGAPADADQAIDRDAPGESDEDDTSVRAHRRNRAPVVAEATNRWQVFAAWAGLIVVVAGLGAGLFVFRDAIMNTWPETAGLYDGLELAQPGFGLVLAPPSARQAKIDGATK